MKEKRMPYRFICEMPCRSIGRVEFTESEKKTNEKEAQEAYEYFFGKNKSNKELIKA